MGCLTAGDDLHLPVVPAGVPLVTAHGHFAVSESAAHRRRDWQGSGVVRGFVIAEETGLGAAGGQDHRHAIRIAVVPSPEGAADVSSPRTTPRAVRPSRF